MLSDRVIGRPRDIIDDADRIGIFIDGMSASEFIADERTIFAIERLLQRITEAAIQITATGAEIEGLPIAQMRALGNRLRHEYGEIDRKQIFDLARIDVPQVRVAAELALEG